MSESASNHESEREPGFNIKPPDKKTSPERETVSHSRERSQSPLVREFDKWNAEREQQTMLTASPSVFKFARAEAFTHIGALAANRW
jgi:hypothetical protein